MKYGSLFSGIGGLDLGFDRAGMECAWQCEIDTKASLVLAKHWPNVKRYEDVRTIGKHNLEPVDVICGGFPCQDVSLAGNRAGLEGKRSTLWSEFARIICELEPRWVVVENVRGLFSSDGGRFFGNILRDLAECGYDAEWQVLSAAAFDAPHIRQRVYIVAYSENVLRNDKNIKNSSHRTSEQTIFYENGWANKFRRCINGRVRFGTWSSEPGVRRVDDGIPAWMDRNHQLGNAVVPQVAEWIGKRIVEVGSL